MHNIVKLCGKSANFLLILAGKTCVRYSTAGALLKLNRQAMVEETEVLPTNIHRFSQLNSQVFGTCLNLLNYSFSTLSTSPIIYHHELKIKKGL